MERTYIDWNKNEDIYEKISKLKQKLRETDYKVLKYIDGLIPEDEYIVIKGQRQGWRNEIRRLEEQLSNQLE